MSSSRRKSKRLQEKKSILSDERSEERSKEKSKSRKKPCKKTKYVKCIFHPPGTVLSGTPPTEVTSETCAVCLGEVPMKPEERARTECGHLYCKECIVMWLSQSAKDVCPTCRGCSVPLKDGNGEEILYDKIPTPPPEIIDPPEFLQQQILQGAIRFGVDGLPAGRLGFDLLMQLMALIPPPPPPPRLVLPRLPPVEVRVRRRRR